MRYSKKIIDITPPVSKKTLKRAAKDAHKRAPGRKFSFLPLVFAFAALAGLAIFIGIQFFLSFATVNVWPSARTVLFQGMVTAQSDVPQIDFINGVIPGKIVQVEKTATKLYPATGKIANEAKAQGIVKVFNTNPQKSQILIAGTRFISQEGKLFRSQARIVIDSMGFQDVQVVAAETGPEYNIGPASFSLPGLAGTPLYTLVYGKSSQAMKGGSKSQVSVVTDEDISQAKNSLADSAMKLAKDELMQQNISPYSLSQDDLDEQIIETSSLIKSGVQLQQFTVKAKVRVAGLAFQKPQLNEFVLHMLETQVADGETADPKSFQISYTIKSFSVDTQQMILAVSAQIHAHESVDLASLRTLLKGQKESDAKRFLDGYGKFEKSQILFWPFWIHAIPQDIRRIHLNFLLD